MDFFLELILIILGEVTAHYFIKWLDNKEHRQ